VLTPGDPEYPENLRAVRDRPALIFVSGRLGRRDARSVALIGSRRASAGGLAVASSIARELVTHGYTVVSGLALGIDTAAHTAALAAGGRTIAVIGTGLCHCYPRQNRPLQERIAREGVVISQFWPDVPPSRQRFPQRNALMSGISLASVVAEASHTSGARTQARFALAHGRPVILLESLLKQEWARELVERPGTHLVRSPGEVPALVDRLTEESLAA
jgi:DNA processing protein